MITLKHTHYYTIKELLEVRKRDQRLKKVIEYVFVNDLKQIYTTIM